MPLLLAALALVLQQPSTSANIPAGAGRAAADAARAGDRATKFTATGRDRLDERLATDTTGGRRRDVSPRRVALTDRHLATAFRDTVARALLRSARAARERQDSSIVSYDATSYQRVSAGMSIGRVGRERLVFRTENASRVRWHRDLGAVVDVKGLRTAMPGIPREGQEEAAQDLRDEAGDTAPLPYYPGQETLLIGAGSVETEVNDREFVHPLAAGAEAYYTYRAGDEASLRLPDGRTIRLRELEVRPRETTWNTVVGSLWFDVDRGQLVRAAYRLSEPVDIWALAKKDDPHAGDDVPKFVKPMIMPMKGQITAIAVEYGLHQGRFWLPRLQAVEGAAQMSFMRVPFKMEHTFRYASVNATSLDSLPGMISIYGRDADRRALDSIPPERQAAWRDSVRTARRDERRARADSVRRRLLKRVAVCDTASHELSTETRGDGRVRVLVRVPCDVEALATSAALPKSIFDEGEELFDDAAREALIAQALSLGAQPAFGPRPPVVAWGLQYVRFNRVEGLSVGANVTQQLGAGYVADATGRLGLADFEPNVELGLARTNLARTIRLGAYNRLVSSNDWGNPLSFGSSVSAFLWGRDDGFYHRASGVDLTGTQERGATHAWRIFAERQRTAAADNDFSLARLTRRTSFAPNLVARHGAWLGASLAATRSVGLDPRGLRVLGDVRVEAAGGETAYGRAAMDATLSRALGAVAGRSPIGALTVAAGTSVGALPAQRRWYLGGTHTVRGQPAGSAAGNAFWFTRGEVAQDLNAGRASLFADLGWAGSRDQVARVGRPLSGAGVGWGMLDGLVRVDVARGIHPSREWRTDLSLEARF